MIYILETHEENYGDDFCCSFQSIFPTYEAADNERKKLLKEFMGNGNGVVDRSKEGNPDDDWVSCDLKENCIMHTWSIKADSRFAPVNPGRYIVSGCCKDTKNGDLQPVTAKCFADLEEAKKYLRDTYFAMLKDMGLEDNGACNAEGEAIPGGLLDESGYSAMAYGYYEGGLNTLEQVMVLNLTKE